ncbi:MAG: hypothetical protein Q8Q33_07100, partial [Chlamydiota bacterium]|nr:hypothetical protein [Chlamydiota bacterium]
IMLDSVKGEALQVYIDTLNKGVYNVSLKEKTSLHNEHRQEISYTQVTHSGADEMLRIETHVMSYDLMGQVKMDLKIDSEKGYLGDGAAFRTLIAGMTQIEFEAWYLSLGPEGQQKLIKALKDVLGADSLAYQKIDEIWQDTNNLRDQDLMNAIQAAISGADQKKADNIVKKAGLTGYVKNKAPHAYDETKGVQDIAELRQMLQSMSLTQFVTWFQNLSDDMQLYLVNALFGYLKNNSNMLTGFQNLLGKEGLDFKNAQGVRDNQALLDALQSAMQSGVYSYAILKMLNMYMKDSFNMKDIILNNFINLSKRLAGVSTGVNHEHAKTTVDETYNFYNSKGQVIKTLQNIKYSNSEMEDNIITYITYDAFNRREKIMSQDQETGIMTDAQAFLAKMADMTDLEFVNWFNSPALSMTAKQAIIGLLNSLGGISINGIDVEFGLTDAGQLKLIIKGDAYYFNSTDENGNAITTKEIILTGLNFEKIYMQIDEDNLVTVSQTTGDGSEVLLAALIKAKLSTAKEKQVKQWLNQNESMKNYVHNKLNHVVDHVTTKVRVNAYNSDNTVSSYTESVVDSNSPDKKETTTYFYTYNSVKESMIEEYFVHETGLRGSGDAFMQLLSKGNEEVGEWLQSLAKSGRITELQSILILLNGMGITLSVEFKVLGFFSVTVNTGLDASALVMVLFMMPGAKFKLSYQDKEYSGKEAWTKLAELMVVAMKDKLADTKTLDTFLKDSGIGALLADYKKVDKTTHNIKVNKYDENHRIVGYSLQTTDDYSNLMSLEEHTIYLNNLGQVDREDVLSLTNGSLTDVEATKRVIVGLAEIEDVGKLIEWFEGITTETQMRSILKVIQDKICGSSDGAACDELNSWDLDAEGLLIKAADWIKNNQEQVGKLLMQYKVYMWLQASGMTKSQIQALNDFMKDFYDKTTLTQAERNKMINGEVSYSALVTLRDSIKKAGGVEAFYNSNSTGLHGFLETLPKSLDKRSFVQKINVYDDSGRLLSLTEIKWNNSAINSRHMVTTFFGYDSLGRINYELVHDWETGQRYDIEAVRQHLAGLLEIKDPKVLMERFANLSGAEMSSKIEALIKAGVLMIAGISTIEQFRTALNNYAVANSCESSDRDCVIGFLAAKGLVTLKENGEVDLDNSTLGSFLFNYEIRTWVSGINGQGGLDDDALQSLMKLMNALGLPAPAGMSSTDKFYGLGLEMMVQSVIELKNKIDKAGGIDNFFAKNKNALDEYLASLDKVISLTTTILKQKIYNARNQLISETETVNSDSDDKTIQRVYTYEYGLRGEVRSTTTVETENGYRTLGAALKAMMTDMTDAEFKTWWESLSYVQRALIMEFIKANGGEMDATELEKIKTFLQEASSDKLDDLVESAYLDTPGSFVDPKTAAKYPIDNLQVITGYVMEVEKEKKTTKEAKKKANQTDLMFIENYLEPMYYKDQQYYKGIQKQVMGEGLILTLDQPAYMIAFQMPILTIIFQAFILQMKPKKKLQNYAYYSSSKVKKTINYYDDKGRVIATTETIKDERRGTMTNTVTTFKEIDSLNQVLIERMLDHETGYQSVGIGFKALLASMDAEAIQTWWEGLSDPLKQAFVEWFNSLNLTIKGIKVEFKLLEIDGKLTLCLKTGDTYKSFREVNGYGISVKDQKLSVTKESGAYNIWSFIQAEVAKQSEEKVNELFEDEDMENYAKNDSKMRDQIHIDKVTQKTKVYAYDSTGQVIATTTTTIDEEGKKNVEYYETTKNSVGENEIEKVINLEYGQLTDREALLALLNKGPAAVGDWIKTLSKNELKAIWDFLTMRGVKFSGA